MLGYTMECLREDSWIDLPAKFLRCKRAGLDTESDGPTQITGQVNRLKTRPDEDKYKKMIDMYRSTTVGFSIAFPDKTSYYVPLQHRRNNVPYAWGLQALKDLLRIAREEGYPMGIHNLSHELKAFERLGITEEVRTNGSLYCTHVASWLAGYDEKPSWSLGLKQLSKRIFKHEMSSFDTVVGGTGSFGVLNPRDEEATNYACEDAIGALELLERTKPILKAWGLTQWFNEVEMPFVWVLNHCTDTGIPIDAEGFTELHQNAADEVWRTRELGQKLAGVDIGSTKSMQKLFEEGIWIPGGEYDSRKGDYPKGKSGDYPINKDVWSTIVERSLDVKDPAKLALGKQLIKVVEDYKSVAKVYSTYSANLVRLAAHSHDGKLHPDFKHAGVSTGRIASSNPNATNMPSRGETAPQIVKNLIVPQGQVLISSDYSQIDLRNLAHFAGGTTQAAFQDLSRDPHQELADDIGVTRDSAKTVMYLTIFGGGPGRLATVLDIPKKQASLILKNFKEMRPEVEALNKKIVASAYRKGYVKTLAGRRKQFSSMLKMDPKRVWQLDGDIKSYYQSQERKAQNLVPQGGSADVVKYAMVKMFLTGLPNDMRMVTQIHDDIRVQTGEQFRDEGMEFIQTHMEAARKTEFWDLSVPLVAEPVSGRSWKEVKD